MITLTYFFFSCSGDHRDLHSFPTRRSSDLYWVLGWTADAAKIGGIALLTTSLAVVYAVLVETGLNRTVIGDRKSTRLNSSHPSISYAVFCLKKKKQKKE